MLTFSIALRFFFSKKGQTILILLGFATGIAVNIFVGSLIQSLQADLINTTVGDQPHIIISHPNDTFIENWQEMIEPIETMEGVIETSPILDTRTFIMNINPDSPDDIILRSGDLDKASGIFNFLEEDRFNGSKPGNAEVTIGIELAYELKVKIGDILELTSDPSPFSERVNVTVSGVFDLGVQSINSLWVFAPTAIGNTIVNASNPITSINIQVNDIFAADTIALELQDVLSSYNISITNWKELNESLLTGLEAQSQSSNLIQVFVLLAVVIGITSVLSITVLQKSRQIGILKAMGLSDRRSALVFVNQGLLFGFFGTALGIAEGYGLIWSFNTFAGTLFPIQISLNFIMLTGTISVLASVAAGLIPARSSSKMEVIEIIRNN